MNSLKSETLDKFAAHLFIQINIIEKNKSRSFILSRPDDLKWKWSEKNERRNPTIAWMELCIRLCISISEKNVRSMLWHLSTFFSPSAQCTVCHSDSFWVHYTRVSGYFKWTTEGLGYSVFDESNEWMWILEKRVLSRLRWFSLVIILFTTFRNSKFFNEILTRFHHPSLFIIFSIIIRQYWNCKRV